MSGKPTEPGYYWLHRGAWHIVEVSKNDGASEGLVYWYTGGEEAFSVEQTLDAQWGGRITQGPEVT